MRESFHVTDLVRIGRSAFLYQPGGDGSPIKFVVATGADLPRVRRAAELRRQLARSGSTRTGRASPFPPEIAYGSWELGDGEAWVLAQAFVPGTDLTTLALEYGGRPPSGLCVEIGHAAGAALASLHTASAALLDDASDAAADVRRSWQAGLLARKDSLVTRMAVIQRVGPLDSTQLRRVHAVARRFSAWRELDRTVSETIPMSCLVHADPHGGNVIVDLDTATGTPSAVLVDDQLTTGDAYYDVACIRNWSFEVMDDEPAAAFADGLATGYQRSRADTVRVADFILYHLIRSLGRLAYYARDDTDWVETYGTSRLHRHIDVLERLARVSRPLDSAIDPFRTRGDCDDD